MIFVREQTNLHTLKAKRQIVDGQQRIRTVLSFLEPESLKDYRADRDFFQIRRAHNPELAGRNFRDLPQAIQRDILGYEFGVHVLPATADDKEVLKIFARMNATGVKLNGQELRNANYFGNFKETMYGLAYEQLERWRDWGICSENNIARMKEVELTSDLVLLMYAGISTKSQGILNKLYTEHDDDVYSDKRVVTSRFHSVMDGIKDIVGVDLRNSIFRKQIFFYVLFALIYDLQYSLKSKLTLSAKKKLPMGLRTKLMRVNDLFEEKRVSERVGELASRRTSTIQSRLPLFRYIKKECTSG